MRNDLPLVAGREPKLDASTQPERDGQWLIYNSYGGSHFLNHSGKWERNDGSMRTTDEHYWPTRESAIEFIRSLSPPAPADGQRNWPVSGDAIRLDRLAKSQDTPLTGSGILNPVLDGTTDQACRNFREWLEASAPDHDWPRPVAAIVHEAERCFAKLATADIRTTDQEGRRVE